VSEQPHREASAGGLRREGRMTVTTTLEKYLIGRPTTKREEDLIALKLFCLFAFILVGLIVAGGSAPRHHHLVKGVSHAVC
jgi:hypothetical protein